MYLRLFDQEWEQAMHEAEMTAGEPQGVVSLLARALLQVIEDTGFEVPGSGSKPPLEVTEG